LDPTPQSFVAVPVFGFVHPVSICVVGGAAIIWPPGETAVVEEDCVGGGALSVKPQPEIAQRSIRDPASVAMTLRNVDLIFISKQGPS
jgi:hypothetical protein